MASKCVENVLKARNDGRFSAETPKLGRVYEDFSFVSFAPGPEIGGGLPVGFVAGTHTHFQFKCAC